MTTIGSICTGYAGLDVAVQQVFGGGVAWHADSDPACQQVLSHLFPWTVNLGDIREVSWQYVPPVDILCAGWPCQPVSGAGPRNGLDDERWLWPHVARAVERLSPRPRLLVLENVPGLLAASEGRAFEQVITSLAALGYVGCYRLVPASGAGACHRRERWFCLAVQDPDRAAWEQWRLAASRPEEGRWPWADPGRRGRMAPANPGGKLLPELAGEPPAQEAWPQAGDGPEDRDRAWPDGAWGDYLAAVRRQERVFGRLAPPASVPAAHRERPVLSTRFTEWMMGLPDGWVTGAGLAVKDEHRVIGNGVVPQQAALAIRLILGLTEILEEAA